MARLATKQQTGIASLGRYTTAHGPSMAHPLNVAWAILICLVFSNENAWLWLCWSSYTYGADMRFKVIANFSTIWNIRKELSTLKTELLQLPWQSLCAVHHIKFVTNYNRLPCLFLLQRQKNELDQEMLNLTGELLSTNPDFSTLWNIRRELFEVWLTTKYVTVSTLVRKSFEHWPRTFSML